MIAHSVYYCILLLQTKSVVQQNVRQVATAKLYDARDIFYTLFRM